MIGPLDERPVLQPNKDARGAGMKKRFTFRASINLGVHRAQGTTNDDDAGQPRKSAEAKSGRVELFS